MSEELWMEIHNTVQETVTKTISKKNKCKKAKWLSEEALQIAEERREEKVYSLQYSGLENSMDCIVHGVTKSQTRLSNFHSHPYVTIGKTIALTRRTLVSKVMSLLFNMLSRLVIAFLPRSF